MAILSTGPIDNPLVLGVRQTQFVTVRIVNSTASVLNVLIEGYVLSTVATLYVSEVIILAPGGVATRNYFADLDAFEYRVTSPVIGVAGAEASVWGKGADGQPEAVHRLVLQELIQG